MEVAPRINAREVRIGRDVEFGPGVEIGGIGAPAELVEIGDNVRIGAGVKLLAPEVRVGDFTAIHQNVTANGYSPLSIGSCCWIGQNGFLNCTGPLVIEDGVTFSTYASVWTHLSGGDVLQGFRFLRQGAARIGADSYIGPQSIVGPVEVAARAMVLAGSVVTHDVAGNTVVGGNPARDLTEKLGAPYEEIPVGVRYCTMCRILRSFAEGRVREPYTFQVQVIGVEEFAEPSYSAGGITIAMADCDAAGNSLFDVRDRSYSKLRTPEEIAFMRYLLPHAKFHPRANNTIE
jgi:acetyltransferase-like isoleucine patch superfamily enzyme